MNDTPKRTNEPPSFSFSPSGDLVNFSSVLSHLIEQSPYRTNRRPIWEATGISSAALSQYTLGKARPRFETLIALANFFGVSIDYLVTGRESPKPLSDKGESVAKYVDWALTDLQSKIARRAYLTARVGQLLVEQIESAVETAQVMPIGGMLSVEDGIQLERHSLATFVWNATFEYDVIQVDNRAASVGRYAPAVAANLMANPPRPYQFLLSEHDRTPLAKSVHAFQRILREDFGVTPERLRFCEFRKTTAPVVFGCCIYRLDLATLRLHYPALLLAINEHLTSDGEIAYSSSADEDSRIEILLEADRVPNALKVFHSLWNEAGSW